MEVRVYLYLMALTLAAINGKYLAFEGSYQEATLQLGHGDHKAKASLLFSCCFLSHLKLEERYFVCQIPGCGVTVRRPLNHISQCLKHRSLSPHSSEAKVYQANEGCERMPEKDK